MTIKRVLIYVSILFLFFSCKNIILNNIENEITDDPEEALTRLEVLLPMYESMKDNEKAKFGILYFEALDKNDRPLEHTSLLDFSISFYESNLFNKNDLSYAYLYKARTLYYAEIYNAAIDYLLMALNKANTSDYKLLGKIYFDLGLLSYYQNAYGKAISYYENALFYFNGANEINNVAVANICIGEIWRILGDNDKAQIYYGAALSISDDPAVQGNVYYQISESYYSLFHYDSALYYIKESLKHYTLPENEALKLLLMADIFYAMEEYDSALVHVSKSLELSSDHYTKKDSYKLLVDIYSQLNDHSHVNKFLGIYNNYVDTVLRFEKEPAINIVESLHEIKNENFKINRQRSVLLFLFFIILLCGYFLLRHIQKKHSVKIKKQKKDNNLSSQKKDLVHKINNSKVKAKAEKKFETNQMKESAIREIYNEHLHTEDCAEFILLMKDLYGDQPEKIINEFSQLNEKEVKYIFLFLLDIPIEDIYVILEYKSDSLKKMRYRLAPKLNISSAKELNDFLFSYFSPIVSE